MFGFIVMVLFFFIVVVPFFKFLGWLINEIGRAFPSPEEKAKRKEANRKHEAWMALTFEQKMDILKKQEKLHNSLAKEYY